MNAAAASPAVPAATGAPAATPATPATRSAALVDALRALLLDGELEPGSRLNELALSARFQVSRTPIRAALQKLAGEGLLEHMPNRGYTVPSYELSEILDAYEIRALAEGLAARLAAERGLPHEAQVRLADAMHEADALFARRRGDTRAAYGRINDTFHSVIQDAARCKLLEDVIRLCRRVPMTHARNLVVFSPDEAVRRHEQHRQVLEAILSREPLRAEALMRQHVLNIKAAVVRAAVSGRTLGRR